jgi:hypothetical protein
MLLKAPGSKLAALTSSLIATLIAGPIDANAAEVAVVGPIERIDCKASSVRILGITFVASDRKGASVLCSLANSTSGRFVAAQGQVGAANVVQLTSFSLVPKTSYVSGATSVYLRGEVSEVLLSAGTIAINGALIDASYALPVPGAVVEVVGTQPVLGGIVVPISLTVLSPPAGAEASSSLGSGVTANSSLGSGATANSSLGSGVEANSSLGSGVVANSSMGSGVVANSSMGSGVAANSSMGSGVVANSSLGSGVAANSSMGSGVVANSSMGSGVTANSSMGSGVRSRSVIGSGN